MSKPTPPADPAATERLGVDMARLAVLIEDHPGEAFQDDRLYVIGQRLLDVLDAQLQTASRQRLLALAPDAQRSNGEADT